MAKGIDYETGTNVTADFLDAVQEVLSPLAEGVVIDAASSTQARCKVATDGSGSGQTSIVINGLLRYITAPVLAPSLTGSGAGTYNLYAVAGAGPGFTLQTAAGAGPTDSRKVAEIVWSGSAIDRIDQMVDAVSGHAHRHRPAGTDPLPTGAASTLTNATSNAEGTGTTFARSDHTHDIDFSSGLTVGATAGLTVSVAGSKAAISLSSTTADTGLTIGGDATLYRPSAAKLMTDGALEVTGVLTGGTNSSAAITLPGASAGITFGTANPANLYRSGNDQLKTDDAFVVGSTLTVLGATITLGSTVTLTQAATNRLQIATGNAKNALELTDTSNNTGITIGSDTNIYRLTTDSLATDDSFTVALSLNHTGTGASVLKFYNGTGLAANNSKRTSWLGSSDSPDNTTKNLTSASSLDDTRKFLLNLADTLKTIGIVA